MKNDVEYTPVHLVESVENYALCTLKKIIFCIYLKSVQHGCLDFIK